MKILTSLRGMFLSLICWLVFIRAQKILLFFGLLLSLSYGEAELAALGTYTQKVITFYFLQVILAMVFNLD